MPMTLEAAITFARGLPGVTEGLRWRNRTWFVNERAFVWERPLSTSDIERLGDTPAPEGDILGVALQDLDAKDALLHMGLAGVFTIAHFNGYPAVLVELRACRAAELKKLLAEAHRAAAKASPRRRRTASEASKKKLQGGSRPGPKTQPTRGSVAAFLATLDPSTSADCAQLDAWMREATGSEGVMFGAAIIGYGESTIRYADGREAPWMKIGFAPRKQALTLYGVLGKATASEVAKLGKHTTGKGCLYVKRLADVDAAVLRAMILGAGRR